MRYRKRPCYGPFVDTTRKRAAALRAQQKQRDALPLFAEAIAATQPSIDDVMTQRAEREAIWEQAERDHRAHQWREGRRRLAALGDNLRPVALHYWNTHRWLPGDPGYLIDMCGSIERGKLVPDEISGFRFTASQTMAEHLSIIEARRASFQNGLPLDR